MTKKAESRKQKAQAGETMKRKSILILITLVLTFALPVVAQQQSAAHKAAIKKCNHDYNGSVKEAIADYKSAVKSANKQTGMARAESLAHARKAKALAAAETAKQQCVANAPK